MARTPRIPGDEEAPRTIEPKPVAADTRGTGDIGEPSPTADQPTGDHRRNTGHDDPVASDPAHEPNYDIDAALAAGQAGTTHRATDRAPRVPQSDVQGDPMRPPTAAVNATREMSYDEAIRRANAPKQVAELQEEFTRLQEERAGVVAQGNALDTAAVPQDETQEQREGREGFKQDIADRLREIDTRCGQIMGEIGKLRAVPKLERSVLTEQGWVVPAGREPPKAV